MNTLKHFASGVLGLLIGGILMWAHMSDLVEFCQSQTSSVQAELEDMQHEHQAMAEKLVQTQQERSQAYAELGRELGGKVDLTIPFKPLPKAEQVSQVQIETNEIAGAAKVLAKFENAWKLATRGK